MIPAADVQPLENAETREVDCYYVKNIPVADVASWAMWPSFGTTYIVLGANIALFAWLLWLAVTGGECSTHELQQQQGDGDAVESAPTWLQW